MSSKEMSNSDQPYLFQIQERLPTTLKHYVLQKDDGGIFQVKCHRERNDQLDLEPHDSVLLLVIRDSTEACCIRTSYEGQDDALAVYDCPCTVRLIQLPWSPDKDLPICEGKALEDWHLKIFGSTFYRLTLESPLLRADTLPEPKLQTLPYSHYRSRWVLEWRFLLRCLVVALFLIAGFLTPTIKVRCAGRIEGLN
jgi:hypothetical protein